jgi:hypothetical protein
LQKVNGSHLIGTHQAAVPFHIRAEDCSEFSFDLLCRHRITPLNEKASGGESESLRGFTFKTLGVALFHGHLKKVTFMLKVDRKTELSRIGLRIDLIGGDVQMFYLIDLTSD